MKEHTKQKQVLYSALVFILLTAMVLNLISCYSVKATDLMDGISSNKTDQKAIDDVFVNSTADFSLELFKKSISSESKSSLVSPLSVLLALSMTANGADNKTLSQMEAVLGKDISLQDLNKYLYTYVKNLPSSEKSKLSIANSIWFRDNENALKVEKDFLQKNADYYNAAAYKSAFDKQTVSDINNWVDKHTDGMIDKILDKIDDDTIMYLINAIAFDAKWETVYNKNDIISGNFTAVYGNPQTAEFMNSTESYYLNDGKATGFIKPYYDDKYSFVALLPNEDISIENYIQTLSGNGFINTIKTAEKTSIEASLPKFKYDYTITMNDALSDLGMPDAFSPDNADFSKLGTSPQGNIYIGEVLHKTFISVDELGTKTGAVTKVEMKNTSAAVGEKIVKLDRPFVYAIIDNSTNLPVFLGAVLKLNN